MNGVSTGRVKETAQKKLLLLDDAMEKGILVHVTVTKLFNVYLTVIGDGGRVQGHHFEGV